MTGVDVTLPSSVVWMTFASSKMMLVVEKTPAVSANLSGSAKRGVSAHGSKLALASGLGSPSGPSLDRIIGWTSISLGRRTLQVSVQSGPRNQTSDPNPQPPPDNGAVFAFRKLHQLSKLTSHIEIDRKQRTRGGDVEAVFLGSSKADIAHCLGDQDLAEDRPIRPKAMDAIAGTRPNMSRVVNSKAIIHAVRALGEHTT
jgi:hypothetical protein